MTPKYWAGIVAGMLAIFVVGTLIVRGADKAKNAVLANFPSAFPLLNAGFKVDGNRVGQLQRLQFMRSQPGRVDSAVLTVKVADSSEAARAARCLLRATNADPFGSSTRFVCTSSADSARLRLIPFGHVVLMPDGTQVTLFVAHDAIGDVQQHGYRGTGSRESGDVDIRSADGTFSLTVNGREVVHVSGDSGGGSLVIRGADGRPIVQVSGDSAGGSVKITDANGRTRLDIHGGGRH